MPLRRNGCFQEGFPLPHPSGSVARTTAWPQGTVVNLQVLMSSSALTTKQQGTSSRELLERARGGPCPESVIPVID